MSSKSSDSPSDDVQKRKDLKRTQFWPWDRGRSHDGGNTPRSFDPTSPPKYRVDSYLGTAALVTFTFLTTIALTRLHRVFLHRYRNTNNVPRSFLRSRYRSLFGTVTSVGDGDNFRLFHTPGGRLNGWGWFPPVVFGKFPHRYIPKSRHELKGETIHVRIAGVDAPELPHFGQQGQPGGHEALVWLKHRVLGRRVRVWVHRQDQYERLVGTAYVWRYGFKSDVGAEMLRAGWATIYEARMGAEFGGKKKMYEELEATAKRKRRGMWAWEGKGQAALESPREYKTRMAKEAGETRQAKEDETKDLKIFDKIVNRLFTGTKSMWSGRDKKKTTE